ncbi:exfoliative toxin [Staphylococcus agnetis]|nr:exfoliative toxin [Staphylococcus agnetis]
MSKRIVAIILAAVIVFGGIVMSVVTTLASNIFNGSLSDLDQAPTSVVKNGDPSQQIAEIVVKGEISGESSGGLFGGEGYNHKAALKQLETIKNDDSIKGVLLVVNSPGGSTYESDEFYQKLKEVKDKGKKVYVQMETLAASGGIIFPCQRIKFTQVLKH